jgi:hypothetical protein
VALGLGKRWRNGQSPVVWILYPIDVGIFYPNKSID